MSSELHPIEASALHARRERVFLVLAGIFLGSLALLNVLGISRFIVLASLSWPDGGGGPELTWGRWGQISFALAVGVLPYPITFLCTDLISEFYGRKRANWLVIVGLLLNIWVVFVLWLGAALPQQPEFDENGVPKVEVVAVETESGVQYEAKIPDDYAFYRIKQMAYGAVVASMIAYLMAQFCDVWLFHFWKRLTNGKHLWLRNNGSTIISQLVDTVAVILISQFYARSLPPPAEGSTLAQHLFMLIATGYLFKIAAALMDTIPFYVAVHWLKGYLEFDPLAEEGLAKK
ncbi:queuosine precursor transporter [Mariniblastus fucicola]|uniref:Probable queuosine precursor transporter n=1 Tax=Mariniblastus fucicola TaxID=980251 RepID=A0A5B9PFA2_9BACT|nr:queuosine precursor transporter [Mariniblastus fucicola]QEG23875.1 hypothetical protein MFFC18_37790 [Mariniblastus fucicola]